MHAFDTMSLNTRTISLFAIPLVCVVAGSWWLHHSRKAKTGTMTADDISQYVPLAQKGDVKGHAIVKQIFVYPLKSCRGISVNETNYTPSGLEFDRQWVVLDIEKNRIVTARDFGKMVLISVKIVRDSSSHEGVLRIRIPAGDGADDAVKYVEVPLQPTATTLSEWKTISDVSMLAWDGFDAYVVQPLPSSPSPHELLSDYLGRPVLLCMKGPTPRACIPSAKFPELGTEDMPAHVAFQDVSPIMIASLESLDETADRVRRAEAAGVKGVVKEWTKGEKELKIERFRPNVVVQGAGLPFAEDAWEDIAFVRPEDDGKSTPSMKVVSKCTRCLLPNIDPQTGIRDAAVPFKILAKFRKGLEDTFIRDSCFGVHSVPSVGGVIRVGDRIDIRKWYGEE